VPGTRRQAVAVVGVSVVAKRVPVWRSGRSQGWGYALACGFVEWEPLASSANRYNVTMPPTPPPEGQARICGTVADASGASIPGTEITVLNLATGVQRTTNTDQAGYYSISFLPAGHSCIAATKDHFSTQQVADILLEVNQQERFEFSMLIGTKLDLSRVPIVKRTSTQLALPEPIGSQLRRLQERARLSTEELAERVGLTPRSVFRHLSGKSIPRLNHIGAYEHIFSEVLETTIVIDITSVKRH